MTVNMIKGSEVLLESLSRLGVDTIFGYPGGPVIPIYDALYDFKKIKHYFSRHEQGAAHEADGYARATGKVGVCLSTSGPGATNLVTGIMTAHLDSTPMIAITGQVDSFLLGKDAFQETDIVGITLPITKTNYLVKDIRELIRIIKEAHYIARSGRPGPVLIDIPKDVQVSEISYEEFEEIFEEEIHLEGYIPNTIGHPGQVKKAVRFIEEAKRPLIIAGAGVNKSGAWKELRELAEKLDIPVCSTLLGLGAFPCDHELSLGMLGMHGNVSANLSTQEADLVIALGMRFDDRIAGNPNKFCENAQIIHVDIDPAEIEKNKDVQIPIVGDIKNVLTDFLNIVSPRTNREWVEKTKSWKKEYPMTYVKKSDKLMPQEVLEHLDKILEGEAIVSTDVGQHQMWAAQFLSFKHPRSLLSSGGAGTMGFGLPAALGAQVGMRDKLVVAVVGDGGFQMTFHELMLIKEYNLPVKILILNNSYLGMVRQWQELFLNKRYSSVELSVNPDFEMIGKAYGIKSTTISSRKDLEEKLEDLILSDEAVIINCLVEEEANVLPMIPSGKCVDDMMGMRGEV